MREFDEEELRASLKVVYYGPALSGKTTNLMYLHERLPADRRGDLLTLDTYEDRTLFFDLLPFYMRTPSGLRLKVKVYTVPGQVRYDATRKAGLPRADGIVFVADSILGQQRNNAESFANLENNCRSVGIDLSKVPLVVQFNKRDLADVVPEEDARHVWASAGVPVVFASALYGKGVVKTFHEIMRRTYRSCEPTLRLMERHGLSEEMFMDGLGLSDE
ncbi:MAG TPA: GTPase domain-containing protein [Planctomycetota bacterium]|nr:GTPase domain-containing protein [Planctomycetota bacterium]